ncbi:MAG: ATP-binding protein [Myxococcota bacterium]
MRALYRRMVVAFACAVLIGAAAGLLMAVNLKGQADIELNRLVRSSGLALLAHQLEMTPSERWPEMLAEAQPHFGFALRVHTGTVQSVEDGSREVALPIGLTGQVLVLGPIAAPAAGPLVWPLFVFIATLIVVASVIIALPLAVQLRRTERAIRLLGEGRWSHRLDAEAEGPLRSLARHVNHTATQLASMFREREELLQAVSHEIGTPLSRMRFQLELLEPAVPAPARARLDHLQRDLDELDELSSELVGWVEAGATRRVRESFEVVPVLEMLLELACQDAEHLIPTVEAESPLSIQADQRQFQRAIENLLRNATRYAKHIVVISARVDERTLVIEVRDDGPGVSKEHRERLFEPFTRVRGSRSRTDGGLGLGLAIVHRIMTAHNGTVMILDAPEGGACVRTRWPIASETSPHTNSTASIPIDRMHGSM